MAALVNGECRDGSQGSITATHSNNVKKGFLSQPWELANKKPGIIRVFVTRYVRSISIC